MNDTKKVATKTIIDTFELARRVMRLLDRATNLSSTQKLRALEFVVQNTKENTKEEGAAA